MNDSKSAIVGGVFSFLGMNYLGFAQDTIMALFLGGIGAVGGWLVGKLIKYIEKRVKKN